jgi:hypothetical protein
MTTPAQPADSMDAAIALLMELPQAEQVTVILQLLGNLGTVLAKLAGDSQAHTTLLGKILKEVQK